MPNIAAYSKEEKTMSSEPICLRGRLKYWPSMPMQLEDACRIKAPRARGLELHDIDGDAEEEADEV